MTRTRPTPDDSLGYGMVWCFDPRCSPSLAVGAWVANNRGIYVRTLSGGTISKVRLEVGTASGNISVAAYANNGVGFAAGPSGAPLATSGAIACPATGKQDVSLGASVTLAVGDWLFLSCDNTTATFVRLAFSNVTFFDGLIWRQDSAHPAPTVGTLAATSYVPALMGVA